MSEIQKLRKEVEDWVNKNGPSGLFGPLPNRSCWKCNQAHMWMKTDMETPYQCPWCGHVYFKGKQLTEDDD